MVTRYAFLLVFGILSCGLALDSFAQSGPEVFLFRPSSSPGSLDADRYEVKERPAEASVRSKSRSRAVEKSAAAKSETSQKEQEKVADQPVVVVKPNSDPAGTTDQSKPNRRSWLEVDPRFNYVETTIAPGYLYVDSDSASWFRNYFSAAPVLFLGTRVWLNPSWGFGASYLHSFAGDISAQPGSHKKIQADHRQYEVDVLYRRFAGNSRKSASLIAGLNYNEYQMIVPATSSDRVRVKTKGIGLVLGVRIPQTSKKAFSVRTVLRPDTKVLEGGTAASYTSGRLESATTWSVELKSERVLNRKNVFFWGLAHSVDRMLYKGSATATDPVTGTTLDGISVTSGRTMLNVGFTWGD